MKINAWGQQSMKNCVIQTSVIYKDALQRLNSMRKLRLLGSNHTHLIFYIVVLERVFKLSTLLPRIFLSLTLTRTNSIRLQICLVRLQADMYCDTSLSWVKEKGWVILSDVPRTLEENEFQVSSVPYSIVKIQYTGAVSLGLCDALILGEHQMLPEMA